MNRTLQLCNLESREQVQAICAKMFGTKLRGTAFVSHINTNPKRIARILQLRAQGFIIRDIAKQVGIGKSTIVEILNGRAKGQK